jgi:hypothetical protein
MYLAVLARTSGLWSMPVVCKAHSSSENWIGDILSSKTNVTAAAMSLGVALSAPVKVASCFRSGVTEMYPGCPAGVAMIIYGSSCIYLHKGLV